MSSELEDFIMERWRGLGKVAAAGSFKFEQSASDLGKALASIRPRFLTPYQAYRVEKQRNARIMLDTFRALGYTVSQISPGVHGIRRPGAKGYVPVNAGLKNSAPTALRQETPGARRIEVDVKASLAKYLDQAEREAREGRRVFYPRAWPDKYSETARSLESGILRLIEANFPT